jgi:hypothetical protein
MSDHFTARELGCAYFHSLMLGRHLLSGENMLALNSGNLEDLLIRSERSLFVFAGYPSHLESVILLPSL